MKVVIAEKPSVAHEIAAVLGANSKGNGYLSGNGYKVTWAYGHLIGLVNAKAYGWEKWDKANLPMIPKKFQTAPVADDVKAQLKILSGLFKEADLIINATDAGREGELIFRYIYEYLQERDHINTPFYRLWISSLTDKAIRDGFNEIRPGNEYNRVADAAKARSEADWLIGINATVATTLNVGNGTGVWSVGRVQTPTLAMICKRFIENRDFVPTPYFTLQVLADKDGKQFKASNSTRFDRKEEADQAIAAIKESKQIQVIRIETKPFRQMPPLLYDLTTLQKEANSRFSYSADKTLEVAQSLYEKKLTTYPRTGSRYIPDDVYDLLPELIANTESHPRFGAYAAVLRGCNLGRGSVNAAKVTDHHALLPTEKHPTPAELDRLTREETNIYEMIIGRMLESVSEPCLKDVTTVTLAVHGQEELPFSARGYIIRQAGWRSVLNLKEEKKDDEEDADLPPMTQGDMLHLVSADVLSKQTKAPALLTENTLLGMMEVAGKELENEEEREAMKEIGLGTPATRASIIENLIGKMYVTREKKNLIPTEKGLALYRVVKDMKISNAVVTGEWERKLNLICDGKMDATDFNRDIITYTHEITAELVNTAIDTSNIRMPGQTNCPCPKCRKQNVRFSPKGFVYCPDKECRFIIPTTVCGKKLDERTVITLLAKGETKVIKGLKSKTGKKFDCALKLSPEFKVALALPDRGETREFQGTCPVCGKDTLRMNDANLWCASCTTFSVWRQKCGHTLTVEELHRLVTERMTGLITDFVSQKGKAFSAYIALDESNKDTFRYEDKSVDTEFTCPKCRTKGNMKDNGFKLTCSCGYAIFRTYRGHQFTEAELSTLFAGNTLNINDLTRKDGSSYESDVRLDSEGVPELTGKEKGGSNPTVPYEHACPKCGSKDTLRRNGKKLSCSCGFSLWTDVHGHRLTDKEINTLLDMKKTGLITDFISEKKKSTYSARLSLDKNFNKIRMEFPP